MSLILSIRISLPKWNHTSSHKSTATRRLQIKYFKRKFKNRSGAYSRAITIPYLHTELLVQERRILYLEVIKKITKELADWLLTTYSGKKNNWKKNLTLKSILASVLWKFIMKMSVTCWTLKEKCSILFKTQRVALPSQMPHKSLFTIKTKFTILST